MELPGNINYIQWSVEKIKNDFKLPIEFSKEKNSIE